MKQKLLLIVLLLLSFLVFSQDHKNWSIEANYPISISDNYINDTNGVLDLGIKYRFIDFGIVKLGAGINAGLFSDSGRFIYNEGGVEGASESDYKARNYFIQPRLFSEFNLPFSKRLRPSFALGYSIIASDYSHISTGSGSLPSFNNKSTDGGINLNVGLSYDITSKLFIQVQYDYIGQRVDNQFTDKKTGIGINLIKTGIGFRF